MAYDLKDDVDRLFACFKCGVSPPPSALKERKSSVRKPSRPAKGGSSVVDDKEAPSCSKQGEDNAMEGQKCGSSTTAAIKFRSGQQISPVIFYGSARGVPVKRPSRILRLLQEIRVDLREENVLISRDGVWATFPRQEEAFRFARTHRNSNVFSYQDHLTGKRRFLVSTYVEFWRSPKKLRRDEKPEVNLAHSSHRHSSVMEATGHEQKQLPVQDEVPLKTLPALSSPTLQNEKKNLEGKGDKPPAITQHSSDNREAPRSRSYYQHDDRGSAGQGGRNFARRVTDHRKWDDSRENSGFRTRDDVNDQPKKDERSQSHADEKTGVWRHDRFHELESRVPPSKKRPAFREKKLPAEPQTDTAATGSDKAKLPDLATAKRGEERGGSHPRALDKPDRTFIRADDRRERRGDGFYHRGEIQRNVDPSRERYVGMRGRGDRFNARYGERDLNRAGGFEVEKWKHDLFDEANRSPPPKNEEEQIAKVEALLAL